MKKKRIVFLLLFKGRFVCQRKQTDITRPGDYMPVLKEGGGGGRKEHLKHRTESTEWVEVGGILVIISFSPLIFPALFCCTWRKGNFRIMHRGSVRDRTT